MIYYSDNKYNFYTNKVQFTSSEDGKQSAYCNNVQDYLDMVKHHPWKFSNLVSTTFVPTEDQQSRLELLNSLEVQHKNLYEGECVLFVEHGVILPDSKSQFLLDIQQDYSVQTEEYVNNLRIQEAKALRQDEVDAIVVTTTSGKSFDGDETSQGRMSRAIQAGQITGIASCVWVLANNEPTEVSLQELQEALALAMQAQGAVWAKPYES